MAAPMGSSLKMPVPSASPPAPGEDAGPAATQGFGRLDGGETKT